MRVASRRAVPALCAAALLLCASCGGTTGAGSGDTFPASAEAVPATAPVYVAVNTDSGGEQWTKLRELIDRFPDGDRLEPRLRAELAKYEVQLSDLRAGGGNEVGVALLKSTDTEAIVLARPDDPGDFATAMHHLDSAVVPLAALGTAGDWQVAASTSAGVQAAGKAVSGGSLADSEDYKEMMAALPGDALVKGYVDGTTAGPALYGLFLTVLGVPKELGDKMMPEAGLTELDGIPTGAQSVSATDDGIELQMVTRAKNGKQAPAGAKSGLLSVVPAGVVAFATSRTYGEEYAKQLQQVPGLDIQRMLGVSLEQLTGLIGGEAALYVRPGSPVPEVTAVLEQEHPAAALATVDKLMEKLAPELDTKVERTEVGGSPFRRFAVHDAVHVYYGIVDGRLVITDSLAGIAALRDSGPRLADDPAFKAAADAAGLPDVTTGFAYVDVESAVKVYQGLSALTGEAISERDLANIRPVKSAVVYATGSGPLSITRAFVEVK